MTTLTFQNSVEGAGQWYRTFVVSNIRGGSASSFLYLSFKTPGQITDSSFTVSLNPWQSVTPTVLSSVQAGDKIFDNQVKIFLSQAHAFNGQDRISIGVNGEFVGDYKPYLDSFAVTADEVPDTSGTVAVSCAASPDPALASIAPVVVLSYGATQQSVTLQYGASQNVKLPAGTYTVSAVPVSTPDGAVSAPVRTPAAQVTVVTGQIVPLAVRARPGRIPLPGRPVHCRQPFRKGPPDLSPQW